MYYTKLYINKTNSKYIIRASNTNFPKEQKPELVFGELMLLVLLIVEFDEIYAIL